MTSQDNQHRLDRLALKYLSAIETGDFDVIEAFWTEAGSDADLETMLHGLNAELAVEQYEREHATIISAVLEGVELHMPSAQIIHPATQYLAVRDVAEHIRRNPPAGLTASDLRLNDELRNVTDAVPAELGITQVIRWGGQFGVAPEAFWRAFREVALDLWMERTSASNYQMAARPKRPQRTGDST